MILRKIEKALLCLLTPLLLTSCMGRASKSTTTGKNDIMIHQLRVELEEIKHHIHTTVMQMNVLTNKMVNSEDTMFELKQRELIEQKQSLEANTALLNRLSKKVDDICEVHDKTKACQHAMEEEIKTHGRALHQNKKKIHEIEKQAISLKTHAQEE